MFRKKTELLSQVAAYYSEKIAEHGDTPRGVDWNGAQSQTIRFDQLSKIFDGGGANFSVNDLGCGYGAFLDYLWDKYHAVTYLGIDISQDMINLAEKRHAVKVKSRFITSAEPDQQSDYCVASGIFNVRLERTNAEWYEYLQNTLGVLDRTSNLGFAFNCLTSYSDIDKKQDHLFYADPCQLFDLCKKHYSNQVALLHDYGLYEFTILVRKAP